MSALSEARQAVADLLDAATSAQTHPSMPDRIVPPAIITLPGTPYLTASGTFGSFALGLDVVLVADGKLASTGALALDALIDDAVVALVNAGIGVTEVSEPWQLTAGTATYLAATISTSQAIHL